MDKLTENGPENIIVGFRKTGIHPFNPTEVLKRLPNWDQDIKETEAVDETILDMLKEMRYGTINIVEPKRKKKLNVEAGKSVLCSSEEDYIETEPEYTSASSSVPIPTEKKNKLEGEKATNKKTKGMGKGKKTKKFQENSDKENNSLKNEYDQVVPGCSFDISPPTPYDVNTLPVIFVDDLEGIGQIETVVKDSENSLQNLNEIKEKNSNIEIISNILVSDADLQQMFSKNKAALVSNQTIVSKVTKTGGSKRPSCYKNDAEILKDLMESD
ncbi:hypothetical protein O3G_MSEX008533 [Manduca sexta]|uniref:Uncharacterized protein n=1 Tax=Manduca sexta TaxID=7130 RepID=A0A921ZA04_MANSE|nr:hypothetical protein O3G_MSEX008533 [Manduca sexta]